jgi:hypothetical protein
MYRTLRTLIKTASRPIVGVDRRRKIDLAI